MNPSVLPQVKDKYLFGLCLKNSCLVQAIGLGGKRKKILNSDQLYLNHLSWIIGVMGDKWPYIWILLKKHEISLSCSYLAFSAGFWLESKWCDNTLVLFGFLLMAYQPSWVD